MATVDVGERNSPFEAWMMHHGAAKALGGCLVFWLAVGISLYFTL